VNADRQIDLPRHDDEHHAAGHDGDRGGLDGEVVEVARAEEQPVRLDLERDPDRDQGQQHGDHARIQPEAA